MDALRQVEKGTRWMPWHREAKKDAATGETPRGAGSTHRSADIRMGQPGGSHVPSPAREQTQGSETSQYLEEEKSNEIPVVVASEPGTAQTDVMQMASGL